MMLLALTLPALAVDVDTFSPSGAPLSGGAGLQLVDPRLVPAGTWTAGTVLGFANDPIVSVLPEGETLSVVDSQVSTRLGGSWVFDARGTLVRVDADVPFYPWIGFQPENAGVPGRAFGDTRISATVPVWKQAPEGLSLAVVPALALPTGSEAAWVGTGGLGGALSGAVAWEPKRVARLVVTGNLGVDAVPAGRLNDVDFGSAVKVGAGAAWQPLEKRAWRVGAELDGRYTVVPGEGGGARNPTELHAFTSWADTDGIQATLGVGTGLVAGLGTPDLRLVAAIGWRQPLKKDKKGSIRELGAQAVPGEVPVADPAKPEATTAAGPPGDQDKDGVPDDRDGAPDAPEDRDEFQDGDGVPDPDNDGDTVMDQDDLCPMAPAPEGVLGCPDPDGDGFVARADLCPDEAPRPEELPAVSRGCPGKDVWAEEIALYSGAKHNVLVFPGRIEFTAKDTLTPASEVALKAIGAWLQEHPRAARVEVAVHTDNRELPAAHRARRTQARAEAVVAWLAGGAPAPAGQTVGAGAGVERGRLSAKGYGVAEPLDSNGTRTGRTRNRRVEIRIVEVTPPRRGEK